jgi:hypothetical protein
MKHILLVILFHFIQRAHIVAQHDESSRGAIILTMAGVTVVVVPPYQQSNIATQERARQNTWGGAVLA